MSGISTHVLDTAKGVPAQGVRVSLERGSNGAWTRLADAVTGDGGRVAQLLPAGESLAAGSYRLTFFTAEYFREQASFYPEIDIIFEVHDTSAHYHIPLLLSPYGYTTYRGS